ncbi:glycosyltransferase [Zooshikella sp. RANM57]|uniref:glycosyltransferase n=1 Tax=Zooshikella sp. RANM57 TaxID=3425863 RepID=UPI003D6DB9F1
MHLYEGNQKSINAMPLVSIVIPTYNQEDYVLDAIESARQQTYKNIEIIISDDCSTDGTIKIIDEYIKKNNDYRIKLIKNEINLGITGNVNKLIEYSKGKFIALFAGDDIMYPKKIEKQMQLMESDPNCYICYHDLDVFYVNNTKNNYLYSSRHKPREGDASVLVRYLSFNGGCSCLVRMENKIYCNEKIKYASDWFHHIEILAQNSGYIRYIDDVLGKYRRHESNITNINVLSGFNEVFDMLDMIIEKYPHLRKFASNTKSERMMVYGAKLILSKIYMKGIKYMLKGFFTNPICFISFIYNARKYVMISGVR